jgi:hypothetical protein
VRPDTKGFARDATGDVTQAGHALGGGFAGAFTKAFGVITVALGSVLSVAKVISILKQGVSGARDLAETQSAVNVIFGQGAAAVNKFAENAVRALGQTRNQALGAANTFATFGKSAGLTGPELVSFSTKLVGLSADLASFKNTSPEEAITAIGAALRGESEPIRRYGILLDDATLRQRALALGIIKTTKDALTPQQRVLAAQAEIFAQTTDAQGDFMRTSDGLANQQRITTAAIEEFKTKLGELFLPAVTAVTKFLNDVFIPVLENKVIPAVRAVRDWFAEKVVPVIERSVIPALRSLRDWFTGEVVPAIEQKVIPALKSFWEWVDDKIRTALDVFNTKLAPDFKKALEDIKKSVEDNSGAFGDFAVQLGKLGKLILEVLLPILIAVFWVQTQIQILALKALAGAIDLVGKAIEFNLGTWRKLVAVWDWVVEKAVEFRRRFWDEAWNAGRNLVYGFVAGVQSLGSWLANQITDFIRRNVPDVIRQILKLGSPSRLMFEYGQNTMRGFVDGINATAGKVGDAVARAIPVGGGTGPAGMGGPGGMHVENLNVTAYSDRFSLTQMRDDLALHGAH